MIRHRKDSRKWDSRGSVSSGCPGRHSRSCRHPGEQSPECPHDPGPSGRPPCSSRSGYSAPPGSEPEQKHRAQGDLTSKVAGRNCLYFNQNLQTWLAVWLYVPTSSSVSCFLYNLLQVCRSRIHTHTKALIYRQLRIYIFPRGWLISCLFVPISVTSSQNCKWPWLHPLCSWQI